MSDLFVSVGPKLSISTVSQALCWTSETRVWHGSENEISWALTRPDDPVHWGPANDPESGLIAIVAGRLAFDEHEWARAERLRYSGGLAARIVIDRWVSGGARAVEALNSSAALLLIDPRSRVVRLWTDRLGFYPVFRAVSEQFILCSHPDVLRSVLVDSGQSVEPDIATMAQMLRCGTAAHPKTYWRGIQQVGPAISLTYSGSSKHCLKESNYWAPGFTRTELIKDRGEIVARLSAALKGAVRRRTLKRFGEPALLLSSGADSRVALFGAENPADLTCLTLYDEEPNDELAGAIRLADAAGARHLKLQRNPDYYLEFANQSVSLSGGMWSIESGHFAGLDKLLGRPIQGSLLSGCYADYILKGIALSRVPKKLFGRNLPIYELGDYQTAWHHPHFVLDKKWDRSAQDALSDAHLIGLGPDPELNHLQVEFNRTSPISREPDACGRLSLRRISGYDPIMADAEIIEVASRMCPEEKVNGIPFGMAVSAISGKKGSGVHNLNYYAPVGASERLRNLYFIKASCIRKTRKALGGRPPGNIYRNPVATNGSWPSWPAIIECYDEMTAWTNDKNSYANQIISEIIGADRMRRSASHWAQTEPALLVRAFTLQKWMHITGLS